MIRTLPEALEDEAKCLERDGYRQGPSLMRIAANEIRQLRRRDVQSATEARAPQGAEAPRETPQG